ncbi:substrate-binding domain-containing protein [Aeromicrobium sp. SMF47]|uniref:sugar ABC transporter substrate-binding protein n=1 Tax=Aeromicrobium TaxID=2040 RepID=UPI00129E805D|nr:MULTISPECIES: sugar ABC transporter substrate-binding protein [Aeromicrobium]MRJ75799.1 substrate-binding domain-containing protein [Aeromicrobium yanjiei]MRK00142.1 substrate-binding domain-containing protein [Aeromicrobium sp. S22]
MKTKKISALAAGVAALLVLGACGSSSSDGGSGGGGDSAKAEAAKAKVEEAKGVPGTDDLGSPIDVSSLKGKTIYSIPIDSKAEFYSVGEKAMKKVAAEAGIKFVTFPSDGTQTSFQQGIQQAINAKAGAIMLNGPLAETLGPQIDAAKKAGIPVIPLHLSDSEGEGTPGLEYEAFAPFNQAARLFTQYAIANLEGDPVHALVIQSSETGPSAGMVKTIQDTLKSEGPSGSKTTVMNVPVAQWSTQIQGQVQSALLKDPKINAVLPIYDNMALYAVPGIKQAAPNRDIKVYSFNGTPAILKMVKEGSVAVNVAENPDWVSYVNLDVAFRAMLGEDPIKGETGPLRLIDASNVDETGNPPQSGKGFGDEYPDAFLKLWGLK